MVKGKETRVPKEGRKLRKDKTKKEREQRSR